MFTVEQMTGSGQMSMVDLINHNEDRKKVLRTTPHTYHMDPGHGWLQASYEDLKVLGILGAISACSYRNGDTVYLEEDLDAVTYIKALFGSFETPEYFHWKDNYKSEQYQENTFIRNLNQFHR